jgi:hypothetical protein
VQIFLFINFYRSHFSWKEVTEPGANPTIVSYNASAVKITTPRVAYVVCFENIFYIALKTALGYYNAF